MISKHWPAITTAAISLLPWLLLLAWVHWEAYNQFNNLGSICSLTNGTSLTVWGAFDFGILVSIMLFPAWLIAVPIFSVTLSMFNMNRSRLGPLWAVPFALLAVVYFGLQSSVGAGAHFTEIWAARCR